MAERRLVKLDDDVLLLLLDEIRTADLVNFALTNRRVHSLAHKRLAEHRSLLKYTIVCLNPTCTHVQGCGFIPTQAASLVELCLPSSKIFDYIKCVNLGGLPVGSTLCGSSVTDTMTTITGTNHFNRIHEGVNADSDLLELEKFASSMTVELLFLWQLLPPVVITARCPDSLSWNLAHLGRVAQGCNLNDATPGITLWKRLVISVGQRFLSPRFLTDTMDDTMHLVAPYNLSCAIITTTTFWDTLEDLTMALVSSLEHIHVEIDCPPNPEGRGDTRCWMPRWDHGLRSVFEHSDSVLRGGRLSGFFNEITELSDFPDVDRLNRPECKQGSRTNLWSYLNRTGNYFDLMVTRKSDDPVATEEGSSSLPASHHIDMQGSASTSHFRRSCQSTQPDSAHELGETIVELLLEPDELHQSQPGTIKIHSP